MLKKAIKGLLIVLALIFAYYVVMIFVWPPVYWADEIRGQVVDEETGAPLEGVVITANWELRNIFDVPSGQEMVMEAITDKDGNFMFPSWGPKLRWPLISWSCLMFDDPQLILFKSGYNKKLLSNKVALTARNESAHRHSDWNGKRITLRKFEGSARQYLEQVENLESNLSLALLFYDCSIKKIPRMLIALHLERKRINSSSRSLIEQIEEGHTPASTKCGSSVKEFFRSYLP